MKKLDVPLDVALQGSVAALANCLPPKPHPRQPKPWAQVNYSDILHRIRPLREELASLEEQYAAALQQSEQVTAQVKALEERIAQMKLVPSPSPPPLSPLTGRKITETIRDAGGGVRGVQWMN